MVTVMWISGEVCISLNSVVGDTFSSLYFCPIKFNFVLMDFKKKLCLKKCFIKNKYLNVNLFPLTQLQSLKNWSKFWQELTNHHYRMPLFSLGSRIFSSANDFQLVKVKNRFNVSNCFPKGEKETFKLLSFYK